MAITDQRAVKFANEQMRPICEELRAVYYKCKDMQTRWYGSVAASVPNLSSEQLMDGRNAEGVSRLSGEQINAVMTQINAVTALLEQTGVLSVINHPCVRPIIVE